MSPKDYLVSILSPLLDSPDGLKVEERQDAMGVLLTIDVQKDDMRIVIGKAGETAKAIRQLVRIIGFKNNARVSIKVNEPEGSVYKART